MCKSMREETKETNHVEPGSECASHFNSFGERTVAAVAANPAGNPAFHHSCYRAVEPQFRMLGEMFSADAAVAMFSCTT